MSSEISQPVNVVLLTKNSVYPCLEDSSPAIFRRRNFVLYGYFKEV